MSSTQPFTRTRSRTRAGPSNEKPGPPAINVAAPPPSPPPNLPPSSPDGAAASPAVTTSPLDRGFISYETITPTRKRKRPSTYSVGPTPQIDPNGPNTRRSNETRLRVQAAALLGDFCVITHEPNVCSVNEGCHCVPRSWMENAKDLIRAIEFHLGFRYSSSLHLDTRWNVFFLLASYHKYLDRDGLLIIPEPDVIRRVRQYAVDNAERGLGEKVHFQEALPMPPKMWRYRILSLKMPRSHHILRKTLENIDGKWEDTGKSVKYSSFITLPTTWIHVHPCYIIINAYRKVYQKKSWPSWWSDEDCNDVDTILRIGNMWLDSAALEIPAEFRPDPDVHQRPDDDFSVDELVDDIFMDSDYELSIESSDEDEQTNDSDAVWQVDFSDEEGQADENGQADGQGLEEGRSNLEDEDDVEADDDEGARSDSSAEVSSEDDGEDYKKNDDENSDEEVDIDSDGSPRSTPAPPAYCPPGVTWDFHAVSDQGSRKRRKIGPSSDDSDNPFHSSPSIPKGKGKARALPREEEEEELEEEEDEEQ